MTLRAHSHLSTYINTVEFLGEVLLSFPDFPDLGDGNWGEKEIKKCKGVNYSPTYRK